jgi:hypothetical protein
MLRPLWKTKPDTAIRLRGQIEKDFRLGDCRRLKTILYGAESSRLIWPWQDRNRVFSCVKASTFALMFAPAIWLVYQVAAEQFGPVPLGGMTYWSGFWALALLLIALAITPALAIFRWRHLIIVRRMIW